MVAYVTLLTYATHLQNYNIKYIIRDNKMATSEAQKKATAKWHKANFSKIAIHKDTHARAKAQANARKKSLTMHFKALVDECELKDFFSTEDEVINNE
jgi:hypothetical protein